MEGLRTEVDGVQLAPQLRAVGGAVQQDCSWLMSDGSSASS